jgi:hypothetical protein
MLTATRIDASKMKLTAASCLSLAAKVESERHTKLADFGRLAQAAISPHTIATREIEIMRDLNWRVSTTTTILFLRVYAMETGSDGNLWMAIVLAAICSLLSPALAIEDSELIAVATIAVAVHARRPNQTAEVPAYFERFETQRVKAAVEATVDIVRSVLNDTESPIRKLFSAPERTFVALLPFEAPPIK